MYCLRGIERAWCLVLLALGMACQGAFHVEGLVYEAEEWTEPKDAWLLNQSSPQKWNLWTQEPGIKEKRSGGGVLQAPRCNRDRRTAAEGAPMLHTRITGIPAGCYCVYLSMSVRPLGYSFDGGRTWCKSKAGETCLGAFDITDGVFELWIDDCFCDEKNPGTAYYDYIRLLPVKKEPVAYDLKAFTLPDGRTQISWISKRKVGRSMVLYWAGAETPRRVEESEDGLRNHAVVLPPLEQGRTYRVRIESPLSEAGVSHGHVLSGELEFVAGARPRPARSQATSVRLSVDEPTAAPRGIWPVVSGVPFGKGVLADVSDVVLLDGLGRAVPAGFEATSYWEDGSVRWLTVSFLADMKVQSESYTLKTGMLSRPSMKPSGKCRELFMAFASVVSEVFDVSVILGDGTRLKARNWKAEILGTSWNGCRGAVSCELAEGTGRTLFRYRLEQLYTDADRAVIVESRHSLTHVDYSADRILVRSASVSFPFAMGTVMSSDGRRHAGAVSFRQFHEKRGQVQSGGKTEEREHLDGFLCSLDDGGGIVSSLLAHDFWETYPKGLVREGGRLRLELLPELPKSGYLPHDWLKPEKFFIHHYWLEDGCYQFRAGLEIEQRVTAVSGRLGSSTGSSLRDWLQKPLFACCTPAYYCGTGAFGSVEPSSPDYFPEYDKAFEESFENLENGRQARGEYGWMNYGDWFGERGWNWGNNEYDLPFVLVIQFARTGNRAYLERALQMVRHYTTVDIAHAVPASEPLKELVYEHCVGHVGNFFKPDDPRIKGMNLKKSLLWWGLHDKQGGHSPHAGIYLATSLTGDMRARGVSEACCWNQSRRYTADYDFTIERTVGWSLINSTYSYYMTNNPYYLNGSRLFMEAICKKQNPKTGCFDLPLDTSECDCEDKKEHRGGKPFAVGVLMHGLIRYYEQTGERAAADVMVNICRWLLSPEVWNESKNGWRYRTGCKKYRDNGWYCTTATEGLAYASVLTGDKTYAMHVAETYGPYLRRVTGTSPASGKDFTQQMRHAPFTLFNLHRALGVTSLPNHVRFAVRGQTQGLVMDGRGSIALCVRNPNRQAGSLSVRIDAAENADFGKDALELACEPSRDFRVHTVPFRAEAGKTVRVRYTVTCGRMTRTYDYRAVPVPAVGGATADGNVLVLGDADNWTVRALAALGVDGIERSEDTNGKDFRGCRKVIFGSDSLGRGIKGMRLETAARLAAFVRDGGTVVFMQLNDTDWDMGWTPEPLCVAEPNASLARLVRVGHPLFAGVETERLRGVPCYDSIDCAGKGWNVLAVDGAGQPVMLELAYGRGRYAVVMPSFDRIDSTDVVLDRGACSKILLNLLK